MHTAQYPSNITECFPPIVRYFVRDDIANVVLNEHVMRRWTQNKRYCIYAAGKKQRHDSSINNTAMNHKKCYCVGHLISGRFSELD